MAIRHDAINNHLLNNPHFSEMMETLVHLYNTCPDGSRIRFAQAIEDQFKANSVARGRSAELKNGSSWRDEQKALFAGRGAKWRLARAESVVFALVQSKVEEFRADGVEVDDYKDQTTDAGYVWIRYSGPRGDATSQLMAFEIRTGGSRIDHPKQIISLDPEMIDQLETMSATPFALGLELKLLKKKSTESTDTDEEVKVDLGVATNPEADELQQLIEEQSADDNDELFDDLDI